VIVLSDQFLASSLRDVPLEQLRLEDVVIDRGELLTPAQLDAMEEPYLRYRDTPTGVSPRALPGHPRAVYAITGDEHDEEGHITEEIPNRRQQMAKRMRKLEAAVADMRGPSWYGPAEAPLTLIYWGSTYGPAREAVDLLARQGVTVNLLHFCDLWPLPPAAAEALSRVRQALVVEQNYTGQLARLLRMVTGFTAHRLLRKYDGRPFSPKEIAEAAAAMVGVPALPQWVLGPSGRTAWPRRSCWSTGSARMPIPAAPRALSTAAATSSPAPTGTAGITLPPPTPAAGLPRIPRRLLLPERAPPAPYPCPATP